VSKSHKKANKTANKTEYQRAMDRLEDAVKDLGEAAKGNFADRAAEVLEQTAAKLKSEVPSDDNGYKEPLNTRQANGDEGRLGHWRGEGSERPFRDLDNSRMWGICAGIAPYLGLEIWVVRCLAVTAFIFAPQIIVPAYIIGYFVLDPRSELDEILSDRGERGSRGSSKRMKKRFARKRRRVERAEAKAQARVAKRARRQSASAAEAAPVLPARNMLRNVRGTLQEAELRLRRMEGHVTSGRYELQKELRRIDPT